MKKASIITALFFLILTASAQRLSLNVNPNISPYLSDWEMYQENVQLTISHAGQEIEAKINAQVYRNAY